MYSGSQGIVCEAVSNMNTVTGFIPSQLSHNNKAALFTHVWVYTTIFTLAISKVLQSHTSDLHQNLVVDGH